MRNVASGLKRSAAPQLATAHAAKRRGTISGSALPSCSGQAEPHNGASKSGSRAICGSLLVSAAAAAGIIAHAPSSHGAAHAPVRTPLRSEAARARLPGAWAGRRRASAARGQGQRGRVGRTWMASWGWTDSRKRSCATVRLAAASVISPCAQITWRAAFDAQSLPQKKEPRGPRRTRALPPFTALFGRERVGKHGTPAVAQRSWRH